ncbi:MAG: hypothetical protein WC661_10815 [Opitutaceae bacterium]|jgi:hypothetical protein
MRTIRLLGVLFWFGVSPFAVHATILDVALDGVSFKSLEEAKAGATWGSASNVPLDFTAEGLGCESASGNSFVEAWVQTNPIAVGSYRQPWRFGGFRIEVYGFVDERWPLVDRVFVRHSPDRKHWTTWGQMVRSDQSKRMLFGCELAIPRTTRARYEELLAGFAKTNPPNPKFQEDAVRWILSKDPGYFEKETPFIGYVQFLIEAHVGSGSRRLKGVSVCSDSIVDELRWHLTDANRSEYEGKKWGFFAP